ncbi:MAG: hypothetical protein PHI79_04580 [Sulfurovaceae bacterium]|nr:hypothetical protein [Sulfurovaceae bacterium]MDD5548860.1 hypothetical protein [Sulfurovaceae bacterium]
MPKWTPPTPEELAGAEARIAKDKEQYQAMKDNFEQLKVELEDTFTKNLESLLTPQEKQVIDEGSFQEQWQIYATIHEREVDNKIDAAREKLDSFEEKLYMDQLALENRKLDMQVATNNPDMDLNAFAEWVGNDIPPRLMAELTAAAGNDRAKFVELLVAKYNESITPAKKEDDPENIDQKKEDDGLPTDISGIAGETGDIDKQDGNELQGNEDFLVKSGMYR